MNQQPDARVEVIARTAALDLEAAIMRFLVRLRGGALEPWTPDDRNALRRFVDAILKAARIAPVQPGAQVILLPEEESWGRIRRCIEEQPPGQLQLSPYARLVTDTDVGVLLLENLCPGSVDDTHVEATPDGMATCPECQLRVLILRNRLALHVPSHA